MGMADQIPERQERNIIPQKIRNNGGEGPNQGQCQSGEGPNNRAESDISEQQETSRITEAGLGQRELNESN